MASHQVLTLELGKAYLLYRQPLPQMAELTLMLEIWGEIMADVPDADFKKAMLSHYATAKFFPMPAEILAQVQALGAKEQEALLRRENFEPSQADLEARREAAKEWLPKFAALSSRFGRVLAGAVEPELMPEVVQ